MRTLKYLCTFIIAISFFGSLAAQDIIKASELANLSKVQDIIIVSCQTPEEYEKRHIPNAINIDHKELYNDGPVRGMLKSTEEIARILSSKGITNDKTIVLYDTGTYKYSSRMYWILDYMGAENLQILDGQMVAWRRSRMPFTDVSEDIIESNFIAKVDSSKIATMTDVKDAQNNVDAIIVDARDEDEYNGVSETDIRPGHIPGAINIPFEDVLTGSRKLKSIKNLENLFKEKGLSQDKKIIVYCASSVRASVLYFALKSGLEYPNVKVYDGAYLEWEANSDNPVE